MDKLLAVALTVLFVGLKLTNFIDWSWWWVLSPLWIYVVFVISCFLFVFGYAIHKRAKRRY